LSVVVTFALIGLATDHNWPKMWRVSSAFIAYAAALLIQARTSAGTLQWRWFAIAGAAAGLVSGIVRPEFHVSVLIAGAILAPLVFGSMHWLGLKQWRKLRISIK